MQNQSFFKQYGQLSSREQSSSRALLRNTIADVPLCGPRCTHETRFGTLCGERHESCIMHQTTRSEAASYESTMTTFARHESKTARR